MALKNAGVSEKIIAAMMAAVRSETRPSEKAGIYVLRNGSPVPLERERTEWRLTYSSRTDSQGTNRFKARFDTGQSRLRLSGSEEFLLVCSPDTSPADYPLLREEKKKGTTTAATRREFRVNVKVI